MGTRGRKPGSKLVETITGSRYYLGTGDRVLVPHQYGREMSSYRMVEGVVMYLHPELRYAVVELDFGEAPAGRWDKAERRKIRETFYMEQIQKVSAR